MWACHLNKVMSGYPPRCNPGVSSPTCLHVHLQQSEYVHFGVCTRYRTAGCLETARVPVYPAAFTNQCCTMHAVRSTAPGYDDTVNPKTSTFADTTVSRCLIISVTANTEEIWAILQCPR